MISINNRILSDYRNQSVKRKEIKENIHKKKTIINYILIPG